MDSFISPENVEMACDADDYRHYLEGRCNTDDH